MKTFILYLLIISTVIGCIQPPAPIPPVPVPVPVVPPVGPSTMTVELGDNVVANIHKYAGDSNAINLMSPLHIVVGDVTIDIEANTTVTYSLTDQKGLITFAPKPRITTKVRGITVHPVIDQIVLIAPSSAVAYVNELGMQFQRTIPLNSAPGASTPVDNRPVLYAWVTDDGSCPPCDRMAADFKAVNTATLPFQIYLNPPDIDPETELRPCFKWTSATGARWVYQGWPGLQSFLDMWKKSQTRKVASRTQVAETDHAE